MHPAALEPFEHPLFGVFQRASAEGMDFMFGKPFGEFVQAVEPQEKIAPGKGLWIGRELQVAFETPSGYNSSRSTSTGRVGLKWLMMARGTSMARDQLLISQKLTWNHLPMRMASQGMVGTYCQENNPTSARYNLEMYSCAAPRRD